MINTDKGNIIIYQPKDNFPALEVRLEEETVWLTQKQISQLFVTERSVITKHINNIFKTNELPKDSVCAKFAHTAEDGKTYQTAFYSLDAIISVGYRVNSIRGTQFRIWATNVLLQAVMQTFDSREVYPSLEEKAAHLLYFLVKNHSFVDGNKRIAAALFLWFMEKNRALYRKDASKRIADNALVAITLMIAESRPAEKDIMVNLIVNLINSRN